MTTHGRYAASDSSFAQSTGNAAARGLALIAVAVVIGFLLLWQGGVGGSGSVEVTQNTDTSTSDDQGDSSGDAGATSGSEVDDGSAEQDDSGGILGDTDDGSDTGDETTDTVPITPTTRPLGEVKVAVANGVGVSGLAGERAQLLSTAGFVTLPVNAAANTELSAVYYETGYDLEAEAVAVELGASGEVLRPAVDPGSLVADATAVEGFHIYVVLGSDRRLG